MPTHCRTTGSTQLAGRRAAARGARSGALLSVKASCQSPCLPCPHGLHTQPPGARTPARGALLCFKAPKSLKARLLHEGHLASNGAAEAARKVLLTGLTSVGQTGQATGSCCPGGQWEPGGLSWTECLQPPGTSPPQHCLWDGPRQLRASVMFSAPQVLT